MTTHVESAPFDARRHGQATRLAHLGLALAVIVQLLTSLVMRGPRPGQAPDQMFQLHEYAGLAALGFAALFWIVLLLRRHGTDAARLFPWFSGDARARLWADIRGHWSRMRRLSLPHYDELGALPSAIHGLGLLLMTGIAGLGAVWYAAHLAGAGRGGVGGIAIEAHQLLGNLVWAYLIGHSLLAVFHHLRGEASLAEMWSVGPGGVRGRE